MFADPDFVAARRTGLDGGPDTLRPYPEFTRLNAAVGGALNNAANGMYELAADGFQPFAFAQRSSHLVVIRCVPDHAASRLAMRSCAEGAQPYFSLWNQTKPSCMLTAPAALRRSADLPAGGPWEGPLHEGARARVRIAHSPAARRQMLHPILADFEKYGPEGGPPGQLPFSLGCMSSMNGFHQNTLAAARDFMDFLRMHVSRLLELHRPADEAMMAA